MGWRRRSAPPTLCTLCRPCCAPPCSSEPPARCLPLLLPLAALQRRALAWLQLPPLGGAVQAWTAGATHQHRARCADRSSCNRHSASCLTRLHMHSTHTYAVHTSQPPRKPLHADLATRTHAPPRPSFLRPRPAPPPPRQPPRPSAMALRLSTRSCARVGPLSRPVAVPKAMILADSLRRLPSGPAARQTRAGRVSSILRVQGSRSWRPAPPAAAAAGARTCRLSRAAA